MSTQYTYELYHHGIKGMKWGIRRTPKQLGHDTSSSKKKLTDREKAKIAKAEAKAKAKAAAKEKSKSVKDMTDEEIVRAIERKRLEDAYNQAHPQRENRGKKIVTSMLDNALLPGIESAGKTLVTNFLTKYGDKLIDKNIKKVFPDVDEAKTTAEKIKKFEDTMKLKDLMDTEMQKLTRDVKIKELKDKLKSGDEETLADKVKRLENEQKIKDLEDNDLQNLKRDAEKAKHKVTIDKAKQGIVDDDDDEEKRKKKEEDD